MAMPAYGPLSNNSAAAMDLGLSGQGDRLTKQLQEQQEELRKKRRQQMPAASAMGPAAMSLLGDTGAAV